MLSSSNDHAGQRMSAAGFNVSLVAGHGFAAAIPSAQKHSPPAQTISSDPGRDSIVGGDWVIPVPLAALLRVRPELQHVCSFGAQWASPHGPEEGGWAPFHIVTRGTCRLLVGTERLTLKTGDVAILPHGSPHTVQAETFSDTEAAPVRVSRRTSDSLILKSNVNGAPEVGLICGRFHFEQARDTVVLATLPDIVIFAGEDGHDAARLRALVDMMRAELDFDRPGAALVAQALAQAILTYVLRTQLERTPGEKGVSALLRDRRTARAVAAMLKSPERAWRLAEMADCAGASRATLVRLFNRSTGMSPLAFLTDLRLTLAQSRLRATHASIAIIAEEVGYTSETAFSRAYRRRFACAPVQDRHHAG